MRLMTENGFARRIAGLTEDPDKSAALAECLGLKESDVAHVTGNRYETVYNGSYIVCKGDYEADLEAYGMSDPERVFDGNDRGKKLATYDRNEIRCVFEGEEYYIYRVK